MPRVGTTPNPVEVKFEEVEGEHFDAPAPKAPPQRAGQVDVEPWSGRPTAATSPPLDLSPMSTGQDLAAQAAREAGERKAAMKSLSTLQEPLSKLASKFPDPLTFFGNVEFKQRDVAFGAFGDALRDPAFTDAGARLSAHDVRAAVSAQVKKAWPGCSPKDASRLEQYFMGQLKDSLRERVAPRLQETATRMLDDAAGSFEKTAGDPAAIGALARRLNELSEPSSNPGSARDLKTALGLDPEKPEVSPQELKVALKSRAALLHQEATKMKHHDRPTLFRALAEQDVGPLFKQASGVREGSLLAEQIDAVRAEGEAENTTIGHVKLASVVTAAVFTGGMGLGLGIGAGVSASLSAPSVLEAWESVGTAQAGESAGTMKVGAGDEAQTRAVIETGAAALSVATGAGANHALHGVAERVAAPAVKHMADGIVKGVMHGAVEGAVELGFHQAAHGVDQAVSSSGGASGKNALQRVAEERD